MNIKNNNININNFYIILSIFIVTQVKQIINFFTSQQFLSSHIIATKKKATKLLYTVWSLVMVRNQLPAQVVHACGFNSRILRQ